MVSEGIKFQKRVQKVLLQKWHKKLSNEKISIFNVKKDFDLVSEDKSYIGDAKYYKNIKVPSGKLSTITEYVWLLEKTKAKKKFLIFGKDIKVPMRWLKRWGSLTSVEFYFLKGNTLKKLNP